MTDPRAIIVDGKRPLSGMRPQGYARIVLRPTVLRAAAEEGRCESGPAHRHLHVSIDVAPANWQSRWNGKEQPAGRRVTNRDTLFTQRTPAYLYPISSNRYAYSGATLCNTPIEQTPSKRLAQVGDYRHSKRRFRKPRQHSRDSRIQKSTFTMICLSTRSLTARRCIALSRRICPCQAPSDLPSATRLCCSGPFQRVSPSEKSLHEPRAWRHA